MPEMDGYALMRQIRQVRLDQGGKIERDRAHCLCQRS